MHMFLRATHSNLTKLNEVVENVKKKKFKLVGYIVFKLRFVFKCLVYAYLYHKYDVRFVNVTRSIFSLH